MIASVLLLMPALSAAQSSVTRSLTVDDFQRIYLRGSAQVHLTQVQTPSTTGGFTAIGDSQYVDAMRVDSGDRTLYIDAGDDHHAAQLVLHLEVRELTEVVSEGHSEIIVNGLVGEHLALEGRGAGRFDVRSLEVDDLVVVSEGETHFAINGRTENQFVELAGIGQYRADHLACETGQVTVKGAGLVELNVRDLLDVDIFGTAQVRYSGQPSVRKNVRGSGALSSVR